MPSLTERLALIAAQSPDVPANPVLPLGGEALPAEGPYGPCEMIAPRRQIVSDNPALVSMVGENRAALVAQIRNHILRKRDAFVSEFGRSLGNGRIPTLIAWKPEEMLAVKQRFAELIEADDTMLGAINWMADRTTRKWSINQLATCVISLLGMQALTESVGGCAIPTVESTPKSKSATKLDKPAAAIPTATPPKAVQA